MKVYCLIFDGYSDWEIGYVLPELRRNGVEIITVGFSFCSIKSMGGLTVQPDTTLDKASLDELDLFIIPGGKRWEEESLADEIAATLQALNVKNRPIAAICGATITVARAGLLNNCNHTSNTLEYLQSYSGNRYNGGQYLDKLAVTDKNIITASGLGSIEFTVEIFKLLSIYSDSQCDEWYHFFKGSQAATF